MALICRNVNAAGRRTSIRMESALWEALDEICDRERYSVNQIVTMVETRRRETNLTAAVRVFITTYFRAASGIPVAPPEAEGEDEDAEPHPALPASAPEAEAGAETGAEAAAQPMQELVRRALGAVGPKARKPGGDEPG